MLLLSCDGYILEPTEWPKGSQASCEVLREVSGLLSRPCKKRRASSCDYGGSLWFSSLFIPDSYLLALMITYALIFLLLTWILTLLPADFWQLSFHSLDTDLATCGYS